MDFWVAAFWTLVPTIVVLSIFILILRSVIRADRTERREYAKIEAQEVGDFINTPSLPLVRPLVEDENQGDLIKGVSETADDGIAGNG